MKKIFFLIIIIFSYINCKTITTPIVYDKNIDIIEKETQLIYQLINNKDYQKANEKLENNLKLYPDNLDLLQLKAWLLLEIENYAESEKLFLEILSKNEKNPLVYCGLGRLYRITGNIDKSYTYLKKGLKIQDYSTSLWLELGINQFSQKEYKQSIISFSKAVFIDNENYDALFFKYINKLILGEDLDDIKDIWAKIEKSNYIKSWHYIYHSDILYKLNKKNESLIIIKKGLEKYSSDPYLLNFYSYLLYEEYLKSKKEELLIEAENKILLCIEKANKIEIEFIDTYLSILDEKHDLNKMKEILNKYIIFFPDSEYTFKWNKRILSLEKTN